MYYLFMRLEGMMQSWGIRSWWDERDSNPYPTKSGVTGIIAACMGLPRDHEDIRELGESFTFTVRVDSPGYILKDYQIIQDTIKSDGTINPNSVVSPRYYLYSASFLGVLGFHTEDYFKRVKFALEAPVWAPYLGRKCCIPSLPLLEGITMSDDSIMDIIKIPGLRQLPGVKGAIQPNVIKCLVEDDSLLEYSRSDLQRDQPVSFKERSFNSRMVKTVYISEADFQHMEL